MKTTAKLNLSRISLALLLGGGVGASAFAGPGPQFRAHAHGTPAPSAAAAVKNGCAGCSTTVTFARHERGPAGVGAQGVSMVGTQHACTRCGGVTVTEKGATTTTMIANTGACGAMVCCR